MKRDKNDIKDINKLEDIDSNLNKSVDEMVRDLSPDEMVNFIEGEIFGEEEEIMNKGNNDNKNENNIKEEIMNKDNKTEKKDGIFKKIWRGEHTILTMMILILLAYTIYYINDSFNRDERILELSHNYATHNYGNIQILEERINEVVDKQNEIIDTVNNLRGGKLWARLFQFGKVKPVTPESIEEEIKGGNYEE